MAMLWLGAAVLLTLLSGFLLGQEPGLTSVTAVLVLWAAAAAYVVAAIWPVRVPSGNRASRLTTVVITGRTLLGITVGALSLAFAAAYGEGNLSPYGEQVTAEVTDVRDGCVPGTELCRPSYQLSAGGDDLGWVPFCGPAEPVSTKVEVDIDPLGQREPLTTSCIPGLDAARTITTAWFGGVGAIGLVAVVGPGWRAARSRSLRRPEDTEPG
ncbi:MULTISPECIES: hypothetical protein [unclassified Micromonospora]|uniref:hypothetical protein n=1 Tax=unclassified Micromonospora TaxID=2617518 RepID=UPI003A8BB8EA